MLSVLSVAYPLVAVSRDACGGAEQVLSCLDAGIAAAGHRSLVVACEGSQVAGELISVPVCRGSLCGEAIERARANHRAAIARALAQYHVDLVHMHAVDFDHYLPIDAVPTLVTLHCPPTWYSARVLSAPPPGVYFNAVSSRQHALLANTAQLLPPIENGVRTGFAAPGAKKDSYALVLGRVAPEKGVHIAIVAARDAQVPVLVAGAVHRYPEHQRYFDQEISAHLDTNCRFVGPVGFSEKWRLLANARCLLVCSEVEETSSLVAREALAAGTPVVGFARGALLDAIEHGVTGVLVEHKDQLPAAIKRCQDIDPEACREKARLGFDLNTMVEAYLQLYATLSNPRQ